MNRNFEPDPQGSFSFTSVLSHYADANRDDAGATYDNILKAAEAAFSQHQQDLIHRLLFKSLATGEVSSSPGPYLASPSQPKGPRRQSIDFLVRTNASDRSETPGAASVTPKATDKLEAQSKGAGEKTAAAGGGKAATRGESARERREKAAAAIGDAAGEGTDETTAPRGAAGAEAAVPQTEAAEARSESPREGNGSRGASTAGTAAKETEREPKKTTAEENTRESRGGGQGDGGSMSEFCASWLAVGPGGAFAKAVPTRRRIRRPIDILGWGFG